MEQEYKWKIPQATLSALADYLHGLSGRLRHDTLHMAAVYYDTADSLVYKNGAALRLRMENDRSVCCMKRTVSKSGAKAIREEYEVEADSLAEGLRKLPDAGAPRDLCYLLAFEGDAPFTAEFAVDVGALGAADNMQPFEELELELKSGDAAAFSSYAEQLEADFSLEPQRLSKLARAIQAAGSSR